MWPQADCGANGIHVGYCSSKLDIVSQIIRTVSELHEAFSFDLDGHVVPGPDIPCTWKRVNLDCAISQHCSETSEEVRMPINQRVGEPEDICFLVDCHALFRGQFRHRIALRLDIELNAFFDLGYESRDFGFCWLKLLELAIQLRFGSLEILFGSLNVAGIAINL